MVATDATVADWLQLIRSEYLEIPGLRLTKPQVQRLWGLDATRCDVLLDALIVMKFLTRTSNDGYVRADAGCHRLLQEVAMTDRELKQNVENALGWEPSVDASDIGVSVDESVATLRGNVGSYAEKWAAERAVLHVYGIKGVANDLDVRLASGHERTDTDIAQAAVAALQWHTLLPQERVTVTVSDGWLTLKGAFEWQYQKDAAARAVRALTGVKGVANEIIVKPRLNITDVQTKIEAAFKRSAAIDARRVRVTAQDGNVVLTGHVRSWAERQEAERTAWAAPGVTQIDDRITVTP